MPKEAEIIEIEAKVELLSDVRIPLADTLSTEDGVRKTIQTLFDDIQAIKVKLGMV